jgi:hypothetical protein
VDALKEFEMRRWRIRADGGIASVQIFVLGVFRT